MKLLIDMNLSPEWIAVLERAGFETVHWSTIGDFVVSVIKQFREHLRNGALISVDEKKSRARILPIKD